MHPLRNHGPVCSGWKAWGYPGGKTGKLGSISMIQHPLPQTQSWRTSHFWITFEDIPVVSHNGLAASSSYWTFHWGKIPLRPTRHAMVRIVLYLKNSCVKVEFGIFHISIGLHLMKFSFITEIPVHILRLQRLFFKLCLCHSDRQRFNAVASNDEGKLHRCCNMNRLFHLLEI